MHSHLASELRMGRSVPLCLDSRRSVIFIIIIIIIIIITVGLRVPNRNFSLFNVEINVETLLPLDALQRQMPLAAILV